MTETTMGNIQTVGALLSILSVILIPYPLFRILLGHPKGSNGDLEDEEKRTSGRDQRFLILVAGLVVIASNLTVLNSPFILPLTAFSGLLLLALVSLYIFVPKAPQNAAESRLRALSGFRLALVVLSIALISILAARLAVSL